jgi:hypothetical protein
MKRLTSPLGSSLTLSLVLFLGLVALVYAQQPVRVTDSAGVDIPLMSSTIATHDTALGTITNVKGAVKFCRARASLPSAVSADDDGATALCNLFGSQATFLTANAYGGADGCDLISTASTNATNCKAQAATLYDLSGVNTTATLAYLRIYNLATSPTCSSAVGFVASFPIPASASGAALVRPFVMGRVFTTGIAWCITGGGSSTDNTNAPAGVYVTVSAK